MKDRLPAKQGRADPNSAAFERAVALQKERNFPQAAKIYRDILKRQPTSLKVLGNLAEVLVDSRRFEEALPVLRKALNQDPNSALAHVFLAKSLNELERHDEALERARRALVLDPHSGRAHAALLDVLRALGRYDEARRIVAKAIELAPNRPLFYYQWGLIARWAADDPRLAALEALAEKSKSDPGADRIGIYYALSKAYSDCGDIARAFRCQIAGGALQQPFLKYDETSNLRHLDEICRRFDAKWLERHAGAGNPSPLPVFILGMPRSGTTLVEQILASHPQVHGLGERPFFNDALTELCNKPLVPLSLAHIAEHWSDREWLELGSLYLEAVQRRLPLGTKRIADKVPDNFQLVGLIHAALPNARIIHTRRDPIDTCLSIFSILFTGGSQPYSYDLGQLGRYYRAYQKMMAHWHSVLPPGVMIDVQYEDVVGDLEGEARRIIAHCGLEWDDACLEFYKTERPITSASHAQVRQPIYRSAVGRPRPPRELMLPLLEALGIADVPDGGEPPPSGTTAP